MIQKTQGVIAAGNQYTAEAGIEMFRLGGNAFDAACAAILASFVTESVLTSPAGGGFLLAHTREGKNTLFDFFSQTPQHQAKPQEIDFYPIQVNFGDAVQEFHIGMGSIAVPGNLAGVFQIHQQLGRLPLAVVAEPAIHYAQTGIPISDFQAYCYRLLEPILLNSAAGQQIYAPQGTLLQAGDRLVNRDLSNLLREISKTGLREFYEGAIAQQLVRDCQEQGGSLTLDDLKQYQVLERSPLSIEYRGNTLLTNPPPSSGGKLIAYALTLLSTVDVTAINWGSPEHLELLIKVMRSTNEARSLGFEVTELDLMRATSSEFNPTAMSDRPDSIISKLGSTTHISVMDAEGNAASVTTSNGEGSGYMIPGTGIMMNNMLGEEDLHPQGFHQWTGNCRITSMMSPTMLLKSHQAEAVLGSGGSNRIRTAILQVISNLIDFQMEAEQAVESPRIHWERQVLNIEPGWTEEMLQPATDLWEQLILWQDKNMFFGGVHTVMATLAGSLEGAGDSRRQGITISL